MSTETATVGSQAIQEDLFGVLASGARHLRQHLIGAVGPPDLPAVTGIEAEDQAGIGEDDHPVADDD